MTLLTKSNSNISKQFNANNCIRLPIDICQCNRKTVVTKGSFLSTQTQSQEFKTLNILLPQSSELLALQESRLSSCQIFYAKMELLAEEHLVLVPHTSKVPKTRSLAEMKQL